MMVIYKAIDKPESHRWILYIGQIVAVCVIDASEREKRKFDYNYTRKNLITCKKSANKPSTSCVCYKLSTSLEQVVFVISCQQVWNKLCLLQVVNKFGTKLCLLQVVNKFGTSCVCYKLSTSFEQVVFVTSCQQVWNKLCLLQVINKFGTSCVCYKLSTSLEQVVFVTSCQQVWNKLCLLQVVNKFGTSCVCYKLSTSLEQAVNNL